MNKESIDNMSILISSIIGVILGIIIGVNI